MVRGVGLPRPDCLAGPLFLLRPMNECQRSDKRYAGQHNKEKLNRFLAGIKGELTDPPPPAPVCSSGVSVQNGGKGVPCWVSVTAPSLRLHNLKKEKY